MDSVLKSVYISRSNYYFWRCHVKKSHELIQLEICQRRGIVLDDHKMKRLYTLSKGFEGEHTVYQWLQNYGRGQLDLVTDYWFNHGKDMQVDLLVLLRNRWIVIEVKNYFGHFEYRNHECYLNGKLMSDNHFNQLAHRTKRLQHIANDFDNNIKVESVMVFIDEHCEVNISAEAPTRVIQRHQLRAFIQTLTNEQEYHAGSQKVIHHLEKYRVASPFQPIEIDGQKVAREFRRGLACSECRQFNINTSLLYLRCKSCGHEEYKKSAVQRMALELRYIYYYQPEKITSGIILEYCGGLISKRTIVRSLRSTYPLVNKSSKSYYEVPLLDL